MKWSIFIVVSLLVFCARSDSIAFVFVHGPFETISVWDNVIPLLRGQFPKVVVSLPGHDDAADPSSVTFTDYVNAVVNTVNSQGVPVVLVSHGTGSFITSAAAQTIPAKIRSLVYVGGYIPRNGDSIFSVLRSGGLNRFVTVASGAASVSAAARPVIFNDCVAGGEAYSSTSIAWSSLKEPAAPLSTTLQLDAAFDGVDKVAIITSSDNVVFSSSQRTSASLAHNVSSTETLQGGHMGVICQPRDLARLLQSIAVARGVVVSTTLQFFSGRTRDGEYTGGVSRGNSGRV